MKMDNYNINLNNIKEINMLNKYKREIKKCYNECLVQLNKRELQQKKNIRNKLDYNKNMKELRLKKRKEIDNLI